MPPTNDRRGNAERRSAAKRRRHAETRRLHVELCRSVLRIAVVVDDSDGGRPRLSTRTVRWRREAIDLRCEQGAPELAAALREVVVDERLAGCGVSFAINSTLCVNRATSGATQRVEQEIASFEDRSQLYLALGPGPKMSAVGRKAIDARHEHALVTVANRETIRLLVDAAEKAGLSVDAVESSLVALSRLHGAVGADEGPVMLAQLDENRFEIGVSRAGQLLLEYRPPAEITVGDLGAVIDDHHDRFERFCGRRYGLGSERLTRLRLVGEADQLRATDTTMACRVEAAPLPMRLDGWWSTEGDPPAAEMGAVLGLALRGRCDGVGVSPNLMDEIHALAKPPIKPFLLRAAAPIAATLLVAATLYAVNIEQRMEVSALRREVDQLRPYQARGRLLGGRLRDATVEIENLTKLVDRGPRLSIDPFVERIGKCLPPDVWLKTLRTTDCQSARISGASYTDDGVYDFVHHVEAAPGVREVALRGTGVDQTPSGPATSFEIEVKLDAEPTAPLAPAGDRP